MHCGAIRIPTHSCGLARIHMSQCWCLNEYCSPVFKDALSTQMSMNSTGMNSKQMGVKIYNYTKFKVMDRTQNFIVVMRRKMIHVQILYNSVTTGPG